MKFWCRGMFLCQTIWLSKLPLYMLIFHQVHALQNKTPSMVYTFMDRMHPRAVLGCPRGARFAYPIPEILAGILSCCTRLPSLLFRVIGGGDSDTTRQYNSGSVWNSELLINAVLIDVMYIPRGDAIPFSKAPGSKALFDPVQHHQLLHR